MKIYGVEVTLNESGRIEYGIRDGVRVYPYVWDEKYNCYNQMCGYYKPNSFRKIIHDDRGFFRG